MVANPYVETPTRQAGLPQSLLLLLGSCLPVLGAVLLAPVLPRMQAHFADVAGSAVLVPIVLTLPALVIAMLAPFAVVGTNASDALTAVVTYLLIYAGMNLGAFAVVIAVSRKTNSGEISSFGGLFGYAPGLTVAMTLVSSIS